ncbi:OLC1v1002411C2 [Oldenlandia corymbosa var. corymbosa]|nr:OLC1v1002411C2 [Oldenlandia corymbosa var. corymbosa]
MSVNGGGDGAELSAEQCKIEYIPGKLPVPPHLQPTVSVLAAVIEASHASTLIRKLNKIAPLENLRHVKRIRKKRLDGGKYELSLILCLASETDGQLGGIPTDVLEFIKEYQLSSFVAKVCKYAALTKEEWDEQCKLWPTSYHPPTYNIAGITGFSEDDTRSIVDFMKYAADLARSSDNRVVNAAVIVDPSTKQVISSACDQVFSWTTAESNINIEKNGLDPNTSLNCPGTFESKEHTKLPSSASSDPGSFSNCVSCLHPWRWAEQEFGESSESWHPLRHAAMVAIEYSANQDRLLFPNDGHSGAEIILEECVSFPSTESPSKRQKTSLNNVEDGENHELRARSSDSVRPYLCTGYDIFFVWEPCIM